VTEPVVTLRFEGKDEKALQAVVARILSVIPELEAEVKGRL
jgi:ribosomal protein S10